MLTDKANTICLLHILREYSDADHILPMREIIGKFSTLYGLTVDRRTVYSSIEILRKLDYDIALYSENNIGYYLRSREIDKPEVRLLVDAVCSFPFISAGQAKNLVNELQAQLSIYDRDKYKHLMVMRQERKTQNKQVFLNIEMLDEAIERNQKVSFTYMTYNINKTLVPRRKEEYRADPLRLIFTNEHYYLICVRGGYENVSMYRIDRMRDIVIEDEERTVVIQGKVLTAAVDDAVYAFAGAPEQIVLRCSTDILNDIIDKFGQSIKIEDEDDTVLITFTAPPQGIKFWALQYLPYVEVLQPVWLREQVIESVENNPYMQDR